MKPKKPSEAELAALQGMFRELPPETRAKIRESLERAHRKAMRPKRPPGRPSDDPKREILTLRLTAAEKREMRKAAKKLGLTSLSAYVRRLHQGFMQALTIRKELDE